MSHSQKKNSKEKKKVQTILRKRNSKQKLSLGIPRHQIWKTKGQKSYIIHTVKELKETILKEFNESMMTMSQRIENNKGDRDFFNRNMKLENTIIEIKNSLEGLNSRLEITEDRSN